MRKSKGVLLGGLAIGLFAAAGHATVIYDSGGFESGAGYALGSIQNQPASSPTWSIGGPYSNNGTTGVSSVVVENTNVAPGGGSQAVQFTRAITDGDTYVEPFTYAPPNTPYTVSAQRYVDISWSMKVSSVATNDPFFGVYAFNGNNPLAFGGVAVDNGTGYVISSGNGGFYTPAYTAPLDQWNNFILQLDYNPSNTAVQTETLFVNGVATSSGSFTTTGQTQYTDGDLTSVDGTYDSSNIEIASSGTAYFDNYQVTATNTAVPEPTAGTIFLMGSFVAVLKRRRSRDMSEI